MNGGLPTTWAELSGSQFRVALKLTDGFHDAGFFGYEISKEHLDVMIHPIYFGSGYEYSYHDLNACKLKLSTAFDVSEASLHRAFEEFTIMRFRESASDLLFSFSTYELKIAVEMKECRYKFLNIPNGEDYWSRGY
jgi:hypothetical protein